MKTKIEILICVIVTAIALSAAIVYADTDGMKAESIQLIETEDLDEIQDLIDTYSERMSSAHQMAESARSLSYDEGHDVIQLAKEEYSLSANAKKYYQELYNEEKNKQQVKKIIQASVEYPVAATVWSFLKSCGYNDAVSAGIIGNFMTECGGQTLDLDPYCYTGNYYGLAQWYKDYGLTGSSVNVQLNYLRDSMETTFNTYGRLYRSGFTYKDFCNLTSPSDAALAFAKVYERCGSGSYSIRQKNANKAFQYFG